MWRPQVGPQLRAIEADWCPELFYGGAAGGGKSDFLLGDWLQDVPVYGPAWQGVLFRRTYPELEELLKRSAEIFPHSGAEWTAQDKTWTWPNGARLRLRYLERDMDATRYQGHQYTWIGWDELTQWPTDYAYRFLRARLRSAHAVPTKRIRAAANPGGVGHLWVKASFIDPHPAGMVPFIDTETGMERLFVPARLSDNRILLQADPDYADRLRGLGSEALVRAWLDGDWSVIEGAYFSEFSTDRHVCRPFEIPRHWARIRGMDWGSASPFSVGWYAVASEDHASSVGVIPKGALIKYREWYGMMAGKPNVGLKLSADDVADGIVERERGDPKMSKCVIDPSAAKEDGGPSILSRMSRRGASFMPADNTRMAGWDQLRARLKGDGDGRPMIVFFSTCVHTIRTLPALQHDKNKPEDVDTDGEDHAGDETRYVCMSRPWLAPAPKPKEPDRYRYRRRPPQASGWAS